MARTKKQYFPEFKLKVVLEVQQGEKTAAQLIRELGVHRVALSEWKKQFTETKGYESLKEVRMGLREYFEFYNNRRPYQRLAYRTPAEVYFGI